MPVAQVEQEVTILRQDVQPLKRPRQRRQTYDAAFKLKVVREALERPAGSRIKPTCRDYPEIEPVLIELHAVCQYITVRNCSTEMNLI